MQICVCRRFPLQLHHHWCMEVGCKSHMINYMQISCLTSEGFSASLHCHVWHVEAIYPLWADPPHSLSHALTCSRCSSWSVCHVCHTGGVIDQFIAFGRRNNFYTAVMTSLSHHNDVHWAPTTSLLEIGLWMKIRQMLNRFRSTFLNKCMEADVHLLKHFELPETEKTQKLVTSNFLQNPLKSWAACALKESWTSPASTSGHELINQLLWTVELQAALFRWLKSHQRRQRSMASVTVGFFLDNYF